MTPALPTFPALLQKFFTQRLMQQKRVSAHTISSYRDTFRLLLHQPLCEEPLQEHREGRQCEGHAEGSQ